MVPYFLSTSKRAHALRAPLSIKKCLSHERIAWFSLFIILISAGIIRYGLIDVSLERDEGEYAYAGQLILQGIPPYQEIFNMKWPGIYAAYALLLAVFGETHQGIHIGLLLINALTTIFIFLIARRIIHLLGAVVSASAFAFLSISPCVQGIFANAEHFVIVFVTAGLIVLLRALETGKRHPFFFTGILLGISVVMKQHGFVFCMFGALYIAFHALRQSPILWREMVFQLLFFAMGGISVFILLCLILIWTGVFESFWFWTIDYARAYLSQVPFEVAWQSFIHPALDIWQSSPFLWILIGLGFFSLTTHRIVKNHKVFLLLFALFSMVSILPGFYFRPHYFVLLLPCASLFAGTAICVFTDFLAKFSHKKLQYGIPIFLMGICLFQLIYKQRDFLFHQTPSQVSRMIYGLNPFPESLKIAEFIRKSTGPEDRIAILGSEPQIYFYSQRRSVSGHVYMYPLMENHDAALQMQKNFINDVETHHPKIVVFVNVSTSWLCRPDSQTEVLQWFENYLKKRQLKLVGMVELFTEKTFYDFELPIPWPPRSEYWVGIFKDTSKTENRS
jgi:hypothetical protein